MWARLRVCLGNSEIYCLPLNSCTITQKYPGIAYLIDAAYRSFPLGCG